MKLNTNEKNVLLAIIDRCHDDFFATASDIKYLCDLDSIEQAKGYIGSLVQKKLVVSGHVETCNEFIHGTHSLDVNGHAVSFGCDEYSEEDMLTFYKNMGVL